MKKEKIAVILLNLGGPNSLGEVKNFLFSLFFDKRIIALPLIFRWCVAKIISSLRLKKATEIYKKLGGKSPIVNNTKLQAKQLSESLKGEKEDFEVFIAMRHSKPYIKDVIKKVSAFKPKNVVLLPLYPHFSSTTTLSAFEEYEKEIIKDKYLQSISLKKVCCYYDNKEFLQSQIALIKDVFVKNGLKKSDLKILFSAHSLPCSIIEKGDPYQWQTEKNVELIMKDSFFENVSYKICYQSKVGYNKWLKPTTESEIRAAAQDGLGVVIVPISFVSEHSETLVELDIDYKKLAKDCGINNYLRVKTQGNDKKFIETLKAICLNSIHDFSNQNKTTRNCPNKFCFCINRKNG